MKTVKPLIWPFALLIAGGLAALVAEATAGGEATAGYYGLIKIVSDLTLLFGAGWAFAALGRLILTRLAGPRA